MRVLHISSSDGAGGAAKASCRIHRALRRIGVDSHMLVEYKCNHDATVHAACGLKGLPGRILYAIRSQLDLSPLMMYPHRTATDWTAGRLWRGLVRKVLRFHPDVIHLHWLSAFSSIAELSRLPVPTVWTLQDLDAFTGGCCYPGDCRRFRFHCGSCPQLGSLRPDDFSARTLARKKKFWRSWPVQIVGVSDWVTDLSRQSSVFSPKDHVTIGNGMETGAFSPVAMDRARAGLGLAPETPLILFGALSVSEPRKGGRLLHAALQALSKRPFPVKPEVVVFGRNTRSLTQNLPWRCHDLGVLSSSRTLSEAYSSADVCVVPSIEDACPQVPIESLACGTPVVAFNATGLKDLVEDGVTGRLAKPFEPADLARAIGDILGMPEPEKQAMRERCRRVAVQRFDLQRVARQYLDLYAAMRAAG